MNFTELISARQSCRNYDASREVPREDIVACVEAARLAPSACNSQPWHFTVCVGPRAQAVANCTQSMGMNQFTADAPCLIVVSEAHYNVSASMGSRVKDQDFRSVDIGLATAQLVLAAVDRGLSTCILGWFDEKKLQKLLGIKERIRLVIALGYGAKEEVLRPKKRKEIGEIADFVETSPEI